MLPDDLEQVVDLAGVAGTSGSASASCTRCSRTSTTRSATGCGRSTRPGLTTLSSTRRGSSTPPLMAKIHTVEWTPAMISHPTTRTRCSANWYGILGKRLGRCTQERGAQRHPRLGRRTTRRAVLAHRGVRRRLPHAPAAAGRLHVPLAGRRPGAAGAGVPRDRRHADAATGSRRSGWPTRSTPSASPTRARSRCTTTRASCRRCERAGRRDPRPRGARRPADPRAGRAALQRVPAAVPPEAGAHVRGADRQPGLGRGDPPRLRRRRARRPDDRALRRAAAEGLRLQRHRLPRLHPDGVAAAEERPLLHARLHGEDVHAGRARLGRRRRR